MILAVLLTLFVAADHSVRAAPDHYTLEQWRDTDAIDACGLCGAVCEYDDSKPASAT